MYLSLKPHLLLAVHLTNLLQLTVSKNGMIHLCSPLHQYFMLVNAFMQSNLLYESAFLWQLLKSLIYSTKSRSLS